MLAQRLQKLQEIAVCLINFETNPYVVGHLLKGQQYSKANSKDFIKYK